jgi:K+-sensing histidine kinase KdpD
MSLLPTPPNMQIPTGLAKPMSRGISAAESYMSRSRIKESASRRDFDIDQPRASLGFKVIKSLLGQLDGRITVSSNQPKGAAIQLDVPLDLPS